MLKLSLSRSKLESRLHLTAKVLSISPAAGKKDNDETCRSKVLKIKDKKQNARQSRENLPYYTVSFEVYS